jgi:hypothetical protein
MQDNQIVSQASSAFLNFSSGSNFSPLGVSIGMFAADIEMQTELSLLKTNSAQAEETTSEEC